MHLHSTLRGSPFGEQIGNGDSGIFSQCKCPPICSPGAPEQRDKSLKTYNIFIYFSISMNFIDEDVNDDANEVQDDSVSVVATED